MSAYHVRFETEAEAIAFAASAAVMGHGQSWSVRVARDNGFLAVSVNEYGHEWSGAPDENNGDCE